MLLLPSIIRLNLIVLMFVIVRLHGKRKLVHIGIITQLFSANVSASITKLPSTKNTVSDWCFFKQ